MTKASLLKGVISGKIGFSRGIITIYDFREHMMISSLFGILLHKANDPIKEAQLQYSSAKYSHQMGLSERIKKGKLKPEKSLEVTLRLLNLGGWGKISKHRAGEKTNETRFHVEKSPLATEYVKQFGKTDDPVCHTLRGFLVAGVNAKNKTKFDAIETKCVAKGDSLCEFIVLPRDQLLSLKSEQYRKQVS